MRRYINAVATAIKKYENRTLFDCTDIKSHVVGGIYLIHGKCGNCPGKEKGCAHCNNKGYLMTDLLPDVWYDMPCAQGHCPETTRTLFVIKPKDGRKGIVTDAVHYCYDVAAYVFGWNSPSKGQLDFITSIDRFAWDYAGRALISERLESDNQYYHVCTIALSASASLEEEDIASAEPRLLADIRKQFEREGVDFDSLHEDVEFPKKNIFAELAEL